jgi:hypothetical protein
MALAADCTLPSQLAYMTIEMARLAAVRCLYLMPGHCGVHPAGGRAGRGGGWGCFVLLRRARAAGSSRTVR